MRFVPSLTLKNNPSFGGAINITTVRPRPGDDFGGTVAGVYGTAFQAYEGSFDRGRQWLVELRKDF